MHELGVVFHIMDSLESVAKENELLHVYLSIQEFYFEFLLLLVYSYVGTT